MRILVFIAILLLPYTLQAQKKFQFVAAGGVCTHALPKGPPAEYIPEKSMVGYAAAYHAKYRGFKHLSLGLGIDVLNLHGVYPNGVNNSLLQIPDRFEVSLATPALSLYIIVEGVVRVWRIDVHAGLIAGGAAAENGRPPTNTHRKYPASSGVMIGGIAGLGFDFTKRWGVALDFTPRYHSLKFAGEWQPEGDKMKIVSFPLTLGLSFRL